MTQVVAPEKPKPRTAAWRVAPDLRPIAIRALRRMYHSDLSLFCYCIRRGEGGDVVEGVSHRYTAITLIGLAAQSEDVASQVLGSDGLERTNRQLLDDVPRMNNLGDAALTLWAMIAQRRPEADMVLERVKELNPVDRAQPTVEAAWALAALSVDPGFLTDRKLADRIARRLSASYHQQTGLFPHWLGTPPTSAWRSHVTCFADWVYPVLALAHDYLATSREESVAAAKHSAEHMRRRQGAGGQWWWHYDVRTGRVIEPYPVYSVHQDAMAPMAFFALEKACGVNFDGAVQHGLDWLVKSPERGDSLIDHEADLIWRKVGRREPRKWARGVQAFCSKLHPALRMPGLDMFCPPTAVDYECRPYHLGWYLYAFPDRKMKGTALRDSA